MAVSFPLSLPDTTSFKRARPIRKSVVAQTASPFTGQQEIQVHAGQWWELDIEMIPMTRAQAAPWEAFFAKLNGKEGTFLAGVPGKASPQGTGNGTPLVNGASQTGQDLITDGWDPTETVLKASDLIQLGSGSAAHLHMVLDDATSDGGGNATLTLWPDLRESPGDDDPITVTSAVGLFRLASNEFPFDLSEALHYGFAFAAVEAL